MQYDIFLFTYFRKLNFFFFFFLVINLERTWFSSTLMTMPLFTASFSFVKVKAN